MSHEPVFILRGILTLTCLVGVPAVALVGIPGERPTAVRKAATPPPNRDRLPQSTQASATGIHAVGKNSHSVAGPPEVPTATILDVTAADSSVAAPAISAALPDLMTRQLARLQELGATYYRLESAPNSAADFSFHCRVAGVTRPFEAADPIATNAIAHVLAEIETLRKNGASTAASPSSIYRR